MEVILRLHFDEYLTNQIMDYVYMLNKQEHQKKFNEVLNEIIECMREVRLTLDYKELHNYSCISIYDIGVAQPEIMCEIFYCNPFNPTLLIEHCIKQRKTTDIEKEFREIYGRIIYDKIDIGVVIPEVKKCIGKRGGHYYKYKNRKFYYDNKTQTDVIEKVIDIVDSDVQMI